ncbi:YjcZ family sporulation protein [Paenibacillus sp. GCM10023252]
MSQCVEGTKFGHGGYNSIGIILVLFILLVIIVGTAWFY